MALKLPGIGPATLQKLQKLNINSSRDLLYHFPHRYLDFSHFSPISQLQPYQNVTIKGQIVHLDNIFTRSRKNIQKIILADSTGQIELIWFNQPFLIKNFHLDDTWAFAGTVSPYKGKLSIFSPEYGQFNTGKIIPVYPETKGLSSRWFRKNISLNLSNLIEYEKDPLPPSLLNKFKLPSLTQSLQEIHQPSTAASLSQSRYRLALNEILALLSQARLQKQIWQQFTPHFILKSNQNTEKKLHQLIASFPFKLTSSQQKAWEEIKADLLSPNKVSNRLLCGDVGSGKTVLAILSAYLTHLNRHQSLFLTPTEILAQQHYATFCRFLPDLPIFFLSSKHPLPKKIPSNAIIISTHAAIFQKEKFIKNIALLIVDEQHKFGVKQRSFLDSPHPPHLLTMTATPIPRSLSLTLLGNLDLSLLKETPKNRKKIKTFLIPNHKIVDCYRWLESDIEQRHSQAFIVCPFIEESESLQSIKSAKKEFDHLQKIFSHQKLALIHGKTPIKDREKILSDFSKNQIQILVTTPIIEVGIDFPNATTIIIQSADRFGLSQLHQLRGRVGRGDLQSYCYFFTESEQDHSLSRLHFLEKNHDAFKIAEYDFKTRGPGEAFSTLQHGFPSLKLANLSDVKLIEDSQKFFDSLLQLFPDFDLKQLLKFPLSDSAPVHLN